VEEAWRRLEPGRMAEMVARLADEKAALASAREPLAACTSPDGLAGLRDDLLRAAAHVDDTLAGLVSAGAPGQGVGRVLEAMRAHARALETLYPLRRVLPPLGRLFAEPAWHDRLAELDPELPAGLSVGLHRAGGGEESRARGGFSLYVPERSDASCRLPLVVALHGAFGHGADFLWTWLREARGRGFLLLAPTARASTWSLDAPERDGHALRQMIATVCERWPVDRERVLLTGLSDGGTFALLEGLRAQSPATAIASVAGVLHPANFRAGELSRARGMRIYQVHGARDWLVPVALAHRVRDALLGAGADLTYREIEDLSHAWPREENDRILRWFDPGLALPEGAPA
jgi:phospholipase/carboxylesterase